MEVNEDNHHIENVYAFDENFKEVYIGNVAYVDRGIKKKYFCLGCKRQMQAVKPQSKRKEHFRHHVKPNSTEAKCTYRDETHRHYLAKANAIDLKKIKVPAVYKFHPNKDENKALLIKEAEFINAHTVLNEHYIYENENGDIKVSATFNEKADKYLFLKPDSIFLDKESKPILIIEFVATHKPDQSKLMKLKRLGIDAIQVNVPKSSPEEIRDLFFKTNRTKWLYNHAENQTDYLQLSNSNSGGISEIDNEQRRLFEEGYKCRSAEIGDLIRTIERLLQTEHYQTIERDLRSEIQRVEGIKSAARERLAIIREENIRTGIERHRERREKLKLSSEKFRNKSSNLEERYLRKKREVEQSIAELEFSILELNSSTETISFEFESVISTSERIRREIEELGERKRRDSKFEQDIFRQSTETIQSSIERVRVEIDSLQEFYSNEEFRITEEFRIKIDGIEREIKRINEEQTTITESHRIESTEIGLRIESNNQQFLHEFENGEDSEIRWIAREHRKFHAFENAVLVYKSTHEQNRRIEDYLEKKT